VQVIDRLVDLVVRIGMQPDPTGYVAGAEPWRRSGGPS